MATSFLSMMEARMPPGFRFHPRDEELINDYLAKKLARSDSSCPMMVDVDLNKVEPWDLPGEACVGGKEWYFYSLRDRKYATGQRTNRATHSGYWKATGKDRLVQDSSKGGKLVGMRKTLVFYQGRAPKGKKTDWVMHEFRLDSSSTTTPNALSVSTSASASAKEDWVLCRVFYKSRGLAPKPNVLGSASAAPSASASDNCYDDTGTSSLPPLMDTFINFQQPHHALQGLPSTDQVPCFSSLFSPSHREPLDNRSFAAFHNISNPFVGAFTGDKRTFGVLDGLVKMEEAGSLAPPPAPPASHDGFLTETGAGRSVWTNAPN